MTSHILTSATLKAMASIDSTEKSCPYILLYLVRHGQTPENKSDTFQGQMDTLLSEEGIKQSQLAGNKLQDEHFSHVFSSDLTRARNTAEEIIKKSNFCSQIKIVEDSRLRERCYGAAEGCSKQQFLQMAAQNSIKPHNFTPEGAETLDQVRKRVAEFFDSIVLQIGNSCVKSSAGQAQNDICVNNQIQNGFVTSDHTMGESHEQFCLANVLVVSHGGAIRQLLYYIVDEFASEFPVESRSLRITNVSPNTGVTKFKIFLNKQTKLTEFVKFICLHNAEHLKEDK